jgi:hypothetical protein
MPLLTTKATFQVDSLADPAGMELFYSAESIRLTLSDPGVAIYGPNAQLAPMVYIRHARLQSRESVARLLLEKYRRMPPEALAEIQQVLDERYCAAPGPEADLDRSVEEVFRWTSMSSDPRGTGPLRLWFTSESVLLAARGGYANPARNNTEPRGHRDWSATVPIRSLIRDLADKTHEQFQRAISASENEAVQFCAEITARYASWGGQLRDGHHWPAAPEYWRNPCQSWFRDEPRDLWRRVDIMLRDTAWRLLGRGRQLPLP